MAERCDLYTQNRELTGQTIERGEPVPEGLYRLGVGVVIRNRAGRFLLAKRAPQKIRGGLWEEVGGGVLAGETSGEAAVREVKEELGLQLSLTKGRLVGTYEDETLGERELIDLWLFEQEVDLKALTLAPDEVSEVRWISRLKLEEFREKGQLAWWTTQQLDRLTDGSYTAFCGLDCTECPIYIATEAGDEEKLTKLAAGYSTPQCKFNRHNLKCSGCFSSLAGKSKMCGECPIRKCALDREKKGKAVANCGRCPEFPCALIEQLAPVGLKSRNRLNLIAAGME